MYIVHAAYAIAEDRDFHGLDHRLNMEVDLQSLFGLHVTW